MLNDDKYLETEKLVNEVLTSEPDFFLSKNFAEKVAKIVDKKFAWDSYIREFLIYLGVLAGIAVVVASLAFFWFGDDWKQWLDFIVTNISWVAGINVIIIFILFADRVLLRYFMYKSSPQKNQFI